MLEETDQRPRMFAVSPALAPLGLSLHPMALGKDFSSLAPPSPAILHLSRPSHVIPEAGLTRIPSGPGQLPVKWEQMSALRRPIRTNAHACSSHRWLLLTQASGFSVSPEAEAS